MKEVEWNTCTDPRAMLAWLRSAGKVSQRKLRLYACVAVRRAWHLMDPRGHEAIEAAERFADRGIDKTALRVARLAARAAFQEGQGNRQVAWAACEVVSESMRTDVGRGMGWWYVPRAVGWGQQSDYLRDIFGPLRFCRPPVIAPSWLTWNDCIVRRLAEAAYQEREMPSGHLDPARLGVLADALEESGCSEPLLLSHCRDGGAGHVRGCFVLDLMLGKQ
jgi:hypothetical protein